MSSIEIENRGFDDEYFNFLCKQWETAHIHQLLGMRLTYLGKGAVGIKMIARREYTTIKGRLHGGIITTITDTAMGWSLISLGLNPVTVDMYTNYFAPVFEGDGLLAEANVVHKGKRTAVADATLYNDKGTLVAKSRGTFSLIILNRQEFVPSS